MATTDYDPILTPVNFIRLQGQKSPGFAEVVGASNPVKWDVRDGPWLAGAYLVGGGRLLAKFTVRIRLYSSQDFADWHRWRPLVQREPYGKRPKAKDIWHPWLEMLDVKSAVVEEVGQPEPIDNGAFMIPIKFIEHRRPTLKLLKPTSSTRQADTDPRSVEIEALTGAVQLESLARP
jgi:hypothetical protein